MSQMRTRRFQAGDETGIRQLLGTLRGGHWINLSSLELMRWKWNQAPGGPMDSWVIESEQSDSTWKMVGHHALCPIRFTLGDEDLLCAKTVNSMLLPEFRSKFLYLRFEQECLNDADRRFDATYSCAPGTGRLRRSLGYAINSTWLHMIRGVQSPEIISRYLGLFATRHPHHAWRQVRRAMVAVSASVGWETPPQFHEYSSDEAAASTFFANFWNSARTLAGMSPRRDVADLTWRFWKRPDSRFSTLTYTWEGGASAYCIVNIANPFIFRVEDIFIAPSRVDLLEVFLAALFAWCTQKGALLVRFSTTTDGQPEGLLEVFTRRMYLPPLRHFRPPTEFPRRFSALGKVKDGSALRWNTTEFVIPA